MWQTHVLVFELSFNIDTRYGLLLETMISSYKGEEAKPLKL
jgi:hypothetical protein